MEGVNAVPFCLTCQTMLGTHALAQKMTITAISARVKPGPLFRFWGIGADRDDLVGRGVVGDEEPPVTIAKPSPYSEKERVLTGGCAFRTQHALKDRYLCALIQIRLASWPESF